MKIGIFAPSSACSPERYSKARINATKLGFELVEAQEPSAHYGSKQYLFAADSITSRLDALEDLIKNPELGLILAARGGYGAIDLLSGLASLRQSIMSHPRRGKIFLSGISDVTILLCALADIPNLQVLHGPGFIDAFLEYPDNSSRKRSTEALLELSEGSWRGYRNLGLRILNKPKPAAGPISAKIIGGNLSVLSSLVGSAYLPKFEGSILFLEEIGEKPYRVHRALSQLKNAGLLNGLAGVLLGDFSKCEHPQGHGPGVTEVFEDIFSSVTYPVFCDFPGGHGDLNLPLPLHVEVRLSQQELLPLEADPL